MTFTLKRTMIVAGAAALLVAAAAGVASASSGSVTITTPRTGSSVAQHSNPYIAVAGGVAFAPSNPTTTRFYLRRDGCGTSSDNPHLSVTAGKDAGDGCGLIVDSVLGVGGNADPAAFIDFAAANGMPVALDTSRKVTGVIDITGAGAGLDEVDVSLEALVNGRGVEIGSASESVLLDPRVSDNAVAFTIQPTSSLAGVDVQGLDLRLHIQGPSVDGGYVGLSGKSFANVPSFSASVNRAVAIAVDDPSFSNPTPARLDRSGSSWSVAIKTPVPGRHTIYAESTQGFATSKPISTTFTVTR